MSILTCHSKLKISDISHGTPDAEISLNRCKKSLSLVFKRYVSTVIGVLDANTRMFLS